MTLKILKEENRTSSSRQEKSRGIQGSVSPQNTLPDIEVSS